MTAYYSTNLLQATQSDEFETQMIKEMTPIRPHQLPNEQIICNIHLMCSFKNILKEVCEKLVPVSI